MKVSNSVFLLTIVFLCCIEVSADAFVWLRWKLALGIPAVERRANKFDDLLSSVSDPTAILTGSSLFLYPGYLCDQNTFDKSSSVGSNPLEESISTYSRAHSFEEALGDKIQGRVTVANLATGGALMSDQYLVLKNWLLRGKRPKYAICDLSPREFQDNFQQRIDRSAICRALPEGFAFDELFSANSAASETLSTFDFESGLFRDRAINRSALLKCVPILAKRSTYLWESAAQKDATRSGAVQRSKLKRLPSSTCTIGSKVQNETLLAYYRKAYLPLSASMYAKQMYFLMAYSELARKHGIKVFMVMIPLPEKNIEILPLLFRRRFDSDVERIAQQSGATLVRPAKSDCFADDDFVDFAHMNARGGRKLFGAITKAIGDCTVKSLKN